MKSFRQAFTLLELLVVMAIMGLMATASITSYRSMQQGMQDEAVTRNASQFIRLAYQRSQIDRVPVNVYFWNETRRSETDDSVISVVGRAVAIRRHGRVTGIKGKLLLDEFGDLDVFANRDEDGKIDESDTSYQNDAGMYLYRINGKETNFDDSRSKVSRACTFWEDTAVQMISYPDDDDEKKIKSWGFYVQDGSEGRWKKGDAYGLEFGDFETPDRYVFENSYSSSQENPIVNVKIFNFDPYGSNDGGGQTIGISAIRAGQNGEARALSIGKTVAPNRAQKDQND